MVTSQFVCTPSHGFFAYKLGQLDPQRNNTENISIEGKRKMNPTVNIFPTPVWRIKINDYETINKVLLEKFNQMMEIDKRDPKKKWNSERSLQNRDFMLPLNKEIGRLAALVFKEIGVLHKGFSITGAWANVHPPQQKHHPHSHPNNYLACSYYVKVPEGANTISFLDPRPQVGLIRPPLAKATEYNSEKVDLIIEEGDACFFPCWLRHSVNENKSQEDRTSIAFNLMFTDYVNSMSRPMW